MSAQLYTLDILRLAAGLAAYPRLAAPQASVEKRSTVCGSRVIVALDFGDDGLVSACGLEVRACALGQASAAILAQSLVGRSASEIEAAREALVAMLEGRVVSADVWPSLDILAVAQKFPARHPSIRLAFEAAAEAAQLWRAAA